MRMRFVAPPRAMIEALVFERPPLSSWRKFDRLLRGAEWPTIGALNDYACRTPVLGGMSRPRFVEQTRELLADGLHYEQRVAGRGEIATRTGNWHDLFNALVWLRFPRLKAALNARQVAEIAIAGPKARSRAQCALTHFDEAGVVVAVRDPALLVLWDAHDWHGLFWRERAAWSDGRIAAIVFGHALLEHALQPRQLLVGKALVVSVDAPVPGGAGVDDSFAIDAAAAAVGAGHSLLDPQELRPLPLSGIPGWRSENGDEAFYGTEPCFRPLRPERKYPPALRTPSRASRSGDVQRVSLPS